jgi:hypothetical protein
MLSMCVFSISGAAAAPTYGHSVFDPSWHDDIYIISCAPKPLGAFSLTGHLSLRINIPLEVRLDEGKPLLYNTVNVSAAASHVSYDWSAPSAEISSSARLGSLLLRARQVSASASANILVGLGSGQGNGRAMMSRLP